MEDKKKKFLFVFIIIIILSTMLIVLLKNHQKNSLTLFQKIENKIEMKEDILIYITDKEENCYLCADTKYIISFYEDTYNLEFMYFDKSKNSKEDYRNLLNKFQYSEDYVTSPAVIMIKNGEIRGTANQIVTEDTLRKFLIDFEFLDRKYLEKDFRLDYESFNDKLNQTDKNVIMLYTYGLIEYQTRKKIFNISEKYNFNYTSVYVGISNGLDIVQYVQNTLKENYNLPLVIITQNGEIIDYINSIEEKELVSFLKKNEIITSYS